MIPDYKTNSVYVSSWLRKDYRRIYDDLIALLAKHNVVHEIIPGTKDVWCRDYMPLQLDTDRFLCYTYRPDYLLQKPGDSRYITDATVVCSRMGLRFKKSSLVLDGGNVVKVGDKVIMTEKVFSENPGFSHDDLKRELQKVLECEVVFIPWDRYEKYGHSDGIVKPVSDTAVLMTNYQDYDPSYADEVRNILSKRFEVVALRYHVRKKDSRSWAYINFLSVQNLIILPALGVEEDYQALCQISEYFPDKAIEQVNIEPLVWDGGGLNCVTWCRYLEDE